MAAAKAFLRSAKSATGVAPDRVTTDGHGSYPRAIRSTLGRHVEHRTSRYLNNRLEQDHRRPKRLVRPGLGFGGFHTARRTLAGYETMAMIRKGQVRNIGSSDIRAEATFITGLFEMAA